MEPVAIYWSTYIEQIYYKIVRYVMLKLKKKHYIQHLYTYKKVNSNILIF